MAQLYTQPIRWPRFHFIASWLIVLPLFIVVEAQTPPTTQGLVLHWPFDEGTGTQMSDASGAGNNAILHGSAAWSVSGRIGKCLEASNGAAWTAQNSSLSWQPTSFTVAFWLNPTSFGIHGHAIGSASGWGGFIFHTDQSGGVYCGTNVATRFTPSDLPSNTIETGRWQHITFTHENGTGKFYKNGLLLASRPMTASLAWNGFWMSGNAAVNSIHGRVDEARVYNRALGEEEVFTLAAWPQGSLTSVWRANPISTEWGNSANWLGGAVPTSGSHVTINGCSTCPTLSGPVTVNRLVIKQNGGLNMAGQILTAGSVQWSGCPIQANGGTLITPYPNWANCQFYGSFNLIVRDKSDWGGLSGGNTFHGPVSMIWETGYGSYRPGYNIFKSDFKFVARSGGSHWLPGEYRGKTEIRNEGAAIYVSYYPGTRSVFYGETLIHHLGAGYTACTGDYNNTYTDFYGPVTFISEPPVGVWSDLSINKSGTVTLHNQVAFHCKSGGFAIGSHYDGSTIFKSTASLQTASFTGGSVTLRNVLFENEVNPVSILQQVPGTSNGSISVGPSALIKGPASFKANDINLASSIFEKAVSFEKTGGNLVNGGMSKGGNIFNGPVNFVNSSPDGQMLLGQNQPDIFNNDLSITHGGRGVFNVGLLATGNQLNGNLTINTLPNTTGYVEFGGWGGTTRLAVGKTLTLGTFTSGELRLRGFAQEGTTPQTLTMSGNSGLLFGAGTVFNGPVILSAPRLMLNGTVFNGFSRFVKTSGTVDYCAGGNRFRQGFDINVQVGELKMAQQADDIVEQ